MWIVGGLTPLPETVKFSLSQGVKEMPTTSVLCQVAKHFVPAQQVMFDWNSISKL